MDFNTLINLTKKSYQNSKKLNWENITESIKKTANKTNPSLFDFLGLSKHELDELDLKIKNLNINQTILESNLVKSTNSPISDQFGKDIIKKEAEYIFSKKH